MPSITSGVGGLPESAGAARHVPLESGIEPWIRAVEEWSAPPAWTDASASARAWAERFDLPVAIERFRTLVAPLIGSP